MPKASSAGRSPQVDVRTRSTGVDERDDDDEGDTDQDRQGEQPGEPRLRETEPARAALQHGDRGGRLV
jgi:hypothetical protein